MNPILRALKASYNFFSGDAILLTAAALAFILAALLIHVGAPNVLAAALFIASIVGGLATTLGRERRT